MTRAFWDIAPTKWLIGWRVSRNGILLPHKFLRQKAAIAWASGHCKNELYKYDIRSELRIKGRNGRIRDSRTYGNDPVKSVG